METEVLARWKEEKTFEQTVEKNKASGEEFVFYDGPPFPTGNPHHGTIFVSILKDLIPRYKTMRGYYVPRSWGWDCHGLPIETLAEKNLGIKEKTEIESTLGVKAFNDECRKIVSEFNDSWEIYIDKLGRWVDFGNPYSTASREFMESVIWSFAECYKKGLIYKDYRVNPYCYRCETPLSISDTRLDDATRPKQDRAITVKFQSETDANTYFLAWTTTPWTLPSNLALAVGEDISYAFVTVEKETFILAEALVSSFAKEFGEEPTIQKVTLGKELLGMKYKPLLPYFRDQNPNGFCVISADFVSTEDGTGIVHTAPAFGEDDYWTCRSHNIGVIAPVNEKGEFTDEVSHFSGRNVHEANPDIIKYLKEQGLVVRDETIEHNYPHCWRCRNPLIYRAVDAWYFSVEKIKEKLIANNALISWKPESVQEGRFGKWLENARDWNISRNRYWATPIPVWECSQSDCGHRVVLGSLEELETKAGSTLEDLHKENLDTIHFACEQCGSQMTRVPEVLDGWYESGSMPYGQFHYPFEHAEHFRSHFPADFIVEYTGQIRGWFYYLHVLSTALFDRPAFQNCLVHGTLLAADGKKISKSLKNYTDPMELMKKYGADALRAYLLSSHAVQMADLAFRDDGVEEMVKSLSLPLWNALSFFTTYAEIDEIDSEQLDLTQHESHLTDLDRFILSEIEITIRQVQEELDEYNVHEAAKYLPKFLDTLNNWYIRRSRQRVWAPEKNSPDKLAFYSVLYTTLQRFTQILSPFCPFIAESVWKALGNSESVHMSAWPTIDGTRCNEDLSKRVALTREIISAGLSLRSKASIRVRQPLQELQLAILEELSLESQLPAIQEELNVKSIAIIKDPSLIGERIGKANSRLIGPRYGKDAKRIFSALKSGNFTIDDDGKINIDELVLEHDEAQVVYVGKEGADVEAVKGAVLTFDFNISEELKIEGLARDLVRQIQELRKEADFNISDRIALAVQGGDQVLAAHENYITQETLTAERLPKLENADIEKTVVIGESNVTIQLSRIS